MPQGTMEQQPDRIDMLRLGGVKNGLLTPDPGSQIDRIVCKTEGRASGAPIPFSGDWGLSGSFRYHFDQGRFTVDLNRDREPSRTSDVSCP